MTKLERKIEATGEFKNAECSRGLLYLVLAGIAIWVLVLWLFFG